ncbi:Ankyrin [Lachnellula occidentalis]|uniref:Ankyrin n=1 Tax=Lachnellula occidentalis TaxID=215460 RepID=A0A8H8U6P3_9HELO|nr:Ankyrin [Lachnellula occidentalis]
MSFGFSIGDFIGAIELVNRIRKEFVNAPSQLKAIGDEVRNLSIILVDADVACAQEALDDKQKMKLDDIDKSCRDVLDELQQLLDKNKEILSGSRGIGKRAVRVWKRIQWDPELINNLRSRITSNIVLLNAFNGQFTRANVVKLVQHQDDQERQAVLDWISPIDFPSQQNDIISRRQEGTGLWLLESEEYKAWSSMKAQTLFCPGIPGAGKTILGSIVVEDLNARFRDEESVGIAYVYFNFRRQEEQKLEIVLAGMLKQLLQKRHSLPESIKALYGRHKHDQTRLSRDETRKELQSVISLSSKVFIVADALDECQNEHRPKVMSEVFDLKVDTGLSLFATSRFIPEIISRFEHSHILEIRASDHDVQKYLDGHMSRLPACVRQNHEVQEAIVAKIVTAVKGMQVIPLHLESLVGKRSLRAINTALTRLETPEHTTGKHATVSEAYDKAYDDAMERIKGQVRDSSELAGQVISWITLARRPLAILELLHALAIEIGDSKLDETNIPELEDIASVCAGLVIVDEESNIIRLVHYTTQEYFERTHQRWFPEAQAGIANSCLTYLAFDAFEAGPTPTGDGFDARLRSNALYEYAALNWGHHARLAASIEVDTLIFSLFESQAKLSSSTQVLVVESNFNYYENVEPRQDAAEIISGMHVAAHFGLGNVILNLRAKGQHSDLNSHDCSTPLSIAAARGHIEVVEILLAMSDVNSDSRSVLYSGASHDGRTPLSFAAEEGHEEVAKLLIAKPGVNVNSKGLGRKHSGMRPLSLAASRGHLSVVKQLLAAKCIEVDIKCGKGNTPLSWASQNGHEAVVELLLAKGSVDLNSVNNKGLTPLFLAIRSKHEGVAKTLLATGNVDPMGSWYGWTALLLAVDSGGEALVRSLLATGKVDVNDKCRGNYNRGMTALTLAAVQGHERIVQLLLETGKADKTITDEYGRTAQVHATEKGYSNIVSLLQDDM